MHSSSNYSSLSAIATRLGHRIPLHSSYLHLTLIRFRHRPPPKLAAAITAFSYRRCRAYPYLLTGNALFSRMERFWAGSGIGRNQDMVSDLQSSGVIRSKKVAEVMETIDRALFVPPGAQPYLDSPLPIGHNATISAPHMHAMCLELLENHLKPGMCALDVGSGTGYLTACLAVMVGPEGHAVGVEHIPELVESSIKSIQKSAAAPLLKEGSLSIHAADGRQGWPEHAPYDAIHVGAAALEIPPALIEQLKPGGRLVIPVGNVFQDLQVVDKNEDGSLSVRSETSVRYVPLTSREAQIRGPQY
ncbi:protein-L-isoaspartate O-methyltransferase 1-like isoform X2 [Salvia splendens]|uniref:protein-L-isoaspartate O-methyltransferase 1-like isoform X2 n=1 Tax=Salvia splendens TaxID=180675 RepID=UPI001C268CBB|nr:protein-L-isoaspartate O-methyltransferase 1-like isoform X2 [Salvia splendens]